ncbi:hypothetical protein J6590_034433 [Homalodisca vitripennis]|nr:hypothetical protein J6590_034433 [Homalodisca vitripennis]
MKGGCHQILPSPSTPSLYWYRSVVGQNVTTLRCLRAFRSPRTLLSAVTLALTNYNLRSLRYYWTLRNVREELQKTTEILESL